MTRAVIELWDSAGDSLALIMPAPTGIWWSNQTHGVACQHPEMEGYLLPLSSMAGGGGLQAPELMENVGFGRSLYDPELVERFLAANGLGDNLGPISAQAIAAQLWPPADVYPDMAEAWLWVQVKAEPIVSRIGMDPVILRTVRGKCGVLTWGNSD